MVGSLIQIESRNSLVSKSLLALSVRVLAALV